MDEMRWRAALRPLSWIYSAGTALDGLRYDKGWRKPRRLPAPVISVGNLSAGGAGKTPFVLALAQLLRGAGRSPIILSRGYGRTSGAVARVNADGSAAEFGDEPLWLARGGEYPVYVGADRYQAGMLAAREIELSSRHLFLMDDGFQHRRLERDIDIVLLRADDLKDIALPAGNLRGPLRSLSRADVLVFRDDEISCAPQFLFWLHGRPSPPLQWMVHRALDISAVPSGPAVAFAGIAFPRDFFRDLRAAGIMLKSTLAFADHHDYSFRDVTRILAALQATESRILLTTEKDSVRLCGKARAALEAAAELCATPLRTEIMDPRSCLRQIKTLLERRG